MKYLPVRSDGTQRARRARAKLTAFDVIHDDADIIVVDKAAGVLTVPARRERNTIVGLVSRYVRREVHVVHRLDRDTSGLLVFGKSEGAARVLIESWHRDHERVYRIPPGPAVLRCTRASSSSCIRERKSACASSRRFRPRS
jgi:23S rRNA-/tRNA-specific pseudouridylate synthase